MVFAHLINCSNTLSSALLAWLWQSILFGTCIAGLTYLLIRLLRLRRGTALETGLWLIVLVKFLVPVGPSWSFSLSSTYQQFLRSSPVDTVPSIDPISYNIVNLSPVETGRHETFPLPVALSTHEHPLAIEETTLPRWHRTAFISMVYLFCVVGLFVYRVRSYYALVVHCRSLPQADERTYRIVKNVCQQLGVRRIPTIKISDVNPPFVMNCFRPILVLSRHLLVRPDELETVIVHEIAHLRRGDMFVRYLEWIAGILFFFWPVVAWINRRLDAAREFACDEWALNQGKLTAPEYARCLLRVVQPAHRPRLAYAPCSMATNLKIIERRIDMILLPQRRPTRRRLWRVLAFACLLAWAGFTLTGVAAGPNPVWHNESRSPTEEAVQKRAAEIYHLINELGGADFNNDGILTYLEKDTYLVALAMRNAGPFMEEFPYADRNQSGNLDIIEANDVIRAITLIAYADRRACATTEHVLPLEFCHAALDAQEWLLANASSEPKPSELDPIWSVLCRIKGHPKGYAARMFDHGGPEHLNGPRKFDADSYSQFHELEGNIAAIKEQLAVTSDRETTVKLTRMLTKLETLLSKLGE